MNLQAILFPKIGVCTEQELYFRKDAKVEQLPNQEVLEFKYKGVTWFDTYFNGFSIEKWRKYTKLDNVGLKLNLKGEFKITLLNKEKLHNQIIERIISEHYFKAEEPEEFEIPFDTTETKGMYFFRLEALKNNSYFLGGEYYTEIDEREIKEVNIGIVICTFRREVFIERNIDILKKNILDNVKSPLKDNLNVYISDNGHTLDIKKLANNKIHIYPNKNVGGAGGFTRGLIEIINDTEKTHITHALLMDDDIIIEPEALVKTYNFLRIIKEEYQDTYIGGAMLRLDHQSIQVEAGASWNAGALISLKQGLDLKNAEAVLYNEVEEYTEFNAWWYCCVPIKYVRADNLPLPIFIRGDDLEYGLRNMTNLVLLNGICVWHEPFENKYTSFLHYYIVRNLLIDNSLHVANYNKYQFLKFLFKRITREAVYYRYKNVDLIYKAVNDFYGGIDWIKNEDGEQLHKQIMDLGYKAQEIEKFNIPFYYSDYERSLLEQETRKQRIKRMLTLNGHLLAAKSHRIVPMASARPVNFYRVKTAINYDITTKKAFVTEKSYKELFKVYYGFIKLMFTTFKKYDRARKDYRDRVSEITNIEFWNKYLGREKDII